MWSYDEWWWGDCFQSMPELLEKWQTVLCFSLFLFTKCIKPRRQTRTFHCWLKRGRVPFFFLLHDMPYPQLISSVLSSACGQRQAETLSASFLEISGPSSGCSLHPINQNYTVESSETEGGGERTMCNPFWFLGQIKTVGKISVYLARMDQLKNKQQTNTGTFWVS